MIPKNDNTDKKLNPKNDKNALIKRLNRIEGQIKGIQGMVEEERYCIDILNQITAAKSALNAVGTIILKNHINGCVSNTIKNDDEHKDEMIDELIDIINRYSK